MCSGCCKIWTALQVLWSTVYVICGAAQLIAGIFFMISIPAVHLTSHIWTGSWNVIMGLIGGMVACIGRLSASRQEWLLYMAVSVLAINIVNVVLNEWGLYFSHMGETFKNHPNHMLIDCACFATRVATALAILVSFFDTQFAFCSMQVAPPKPKHTNNNSKINRLHKVHGSHEQVSDIEYIIPRPKSSKPANSTVYNAYSQSWVFDTNSASCSNTPESPYLKILENGNGRSLENGLVKETTHVIDNPVVHIEEASDDSNSNSDRKLCHMRSFSRSASPVLSGTSSRISLNQNPPPIYDCLETIYRSRLNSGNSEHEATQYQTVVMRRDTTSPDVEKVQYASLMKELQKAIVCKKEASPSSDSDKTESNRQESSSKSSDAEFSKELEAALQLIQDLESPNTIETPSDPKPLAVWRNSDASSEKTLSAHSLTEIASPTQPELHSFKPSVNGKGASSVIIRNHQPESQSTSGYSSPSHPSNGHTPTWSTTSSLNGSNTDIGVKPLSYSIHNAQSATVISLYTQDAQPQSKAKSITLVNIVGDSTPTSPTTTTPLIAAITPEPLHHNDSILIHNHRNSENKANVWNVKSLLRKKKQMSLPKLCPELEGAIIKSESLAYLSELELLARHQRNNEIHREIEEKVIQRLGTPRSESNC